MIVCDGRNQQFCALIKWMLEGVWLWKRVRRNRYECGREGHFRGNWGLEENRKNSVRCYRSTFLVGLPKLKYIYKKKKKIRKVLMGLSEATCTFTSCLNWNVCCFFLLKGLALLLLTIIESQIIGIYIRKLHAKLRYC